MRILLFFILTSQIVSCGSSEPKQAPTSAEESLNVERDEVSQKVNNDWQQDLWLSLRSSFATENFLWFGAAPSSIKTHTEADLFCTSINKSLPSEEMIAELEAYNESIDWPEGSTPAFTRDSVYLKDQVRDNAHILCVQKLSK